MNAGRELDVLVAEKVMGLKVIRPDYGGDHWFAIRPNADKQGPGDKYLGPNKHGWGFFATWSPSTDIAAAWEVMDRLRTMATERKLWGPFMEIRVPLDGHRPLWTVRLANDLYGGMNEPHTNDTVWEGSGDTLPLAICHAALNAVGYDLAEHPG